MGLVSGVTWDQGFNRVRIPDFHSEGDWYLGSWGQDLAML